MALTVESKKQLRETVRELRSTLVKDLQDYAEERYLLAVKQKPKLPAERLEHRRRLLSALRQRAEERGTDDGVELTLAAREAAATWLNRLVLIRQLEAFRVSSPAVVTGAWNSTGYKQFRSFAPALCEDDTQGMAPLLRLLFTELEQSLPGLFGDVGLTNLFAMPPATLRRMLEQLDAIDAGAWNDDLTLGWVYQFWNDPDREALDVKLNARGKLEPHELASKTQMFTERYMVDWLLQNSLGPTWLAMCEKNGWTAEVESEGAMARLGALREEWRKDLTKPMEVSGPLEENWKYYVPQPPTAATVAGAPKTLRELKLLDPACGSGHFLLVAFGLLAALYREEARHRRVKWSEREIAQWILEDNLHGVDIDPRAVQIAAAALYLQGQRLSEEAVPRRLNLVAPVLQLGKLKRDDATLTKLGADLRAETGIPTELTVQLIEVLSGVDHLGTLLKVGDAIEKAIEAHEGVFTRTGNQKEMFGSVPVVPLDRAVAKQAVRERLEAFLAAHSTGEDLGVRLRGEQLSAGLRFAELVREGTYHLVVGNPPYQGTSKIRDAKYVTKNYPRGKADLYAAFIERGLELCAPGGALAMVAMQSWMFLGQYTALRENVLANYDLRSLVDLRWCAFEEMRHNVIAMFVIRRTAPTTDSSVALCPTPREEREESLPALGRKRAAVLAQVGRHEFSSRALATVPGSPIIYWWDAPFRKRYSSAPLLGQSFPVQKGIITGNDGRFVRLAWELPKSKIAMFRFHEPQPSSHTLDRFGWVPTVRGGEGREWIEPLMHVLNWAHHGLELKVLHQHEHGSFTKRVQSQDRYFTPGVAFSMIGSGFGARIHRYRSVFGNKGSSVFTEDLAALVCSMNTAASRHILESLNPGLGFEVGDVARLPVLKIGRAAEVVSTLQRSFDQHESARETSVEFTRPGPSSWLEGQTWAQHAVDHGGGEHEPFTPPQLPPSAHAKMSYEFGRRIGRFPANDVVRSKVEGVLFLPARFNLIEPADQPAGDGIFSPDWDIRRKWLVDEFFDLHKSMYENRPVYFPLSSKSRSFVAYVHIHAWKDSTLGDIIATHLLPEKKALEGALHDLKADRKSGKNDKLYSQHLKWVEELDEFIKTMRQISEHGPEGRDVDATYSMDLDDGVMVNASALWPLLDPMWKEPKKWWKELSDPKGKKDFDWAHLSARYFPKRVDEKCQKDPSLAVAHGCFWRYHPAVAYAWELRLQDEIGPDFMIDENDSAACRKAFLSKSAQLAGQLEAKELARREKKKDKQSQLEIEDDAAVDDEPGDEE